MSQRAPLEPPKLAGYEYIDRLGSGGFSEVFLYERTFPRQKVAIKVLYPEVLGGGSTERFTDEANVMASLSTHPYIVAVYQADVSPEGYPYLVMEYYPRPNFNVRARTERFSVSAVLRAGIQVAAAVETAHRSGVLHRDIKPANILTSDYGRPGLTDFGISVADERRTGEAEGMSIPWSPPEVVAGSGVSDERADVYSLGATLYTLLAGRSPFEVPGGANRSIDLIDRIRRTKPPAIERGDVPDSLWRLLLQSMAKAPTARPASAAEFARALQVIEVEQKFDMTPFEVSESSDEPAPAAEPIDADAGSTRVKGVGVIESQPARPSATPGPSHDAFRPNETVIRAKRTPTSAGPSPDLIHATPYVPSSSPPARPSTPVASASGPSVERVLAQPGPTASTYQAAQPVATPPPSRLPDPKVLAAAGAALVAVLVAALFGTGVLGGGGTATTTTSTSTPTVVAELQPVSDVRVVADPAAADLWIATWTLPEGTLPTDVLNVQVVGGEEQSIEPVQRFAFVSQASVVCVIVTSERDGELSAPASNC